MRSWGKRGRLFSQLSSRRFKVPRTVHYWKRVDRMALDLSLTVEYAVNKT
ncbi:hypothetical protein [Metallosphaera sp.]